MPKGEKDKLTKEDKEAILSYKGLKSAYKVAEDFEISHTMVYKIWGKKRNQKETIDTKILKCMIPVFIEHELKVDLDPKMTSRVEKLIQEVLS